MTVARAQQLVSVTRKEVNTRGLPRFQSTPPAFLSAAADEDAVFQFILLSPPRTPAPGPEANGGRTLPEIECLLCTTEATWSMAIHFN